jgi:hypothetical protein
MGRWQAFLVHLGISLTVLGAIAYCVVAFWYPDFLFTTDGGLQGLELLLGVNLVLGPLLTLIVYRTGKSGLRTDLTIIGTLQTICLVAGVWILYTSRPLAIAYVDGSFYTVTAQSFRELDLPTPDLSALPGDSPKWVTVKLPDDYAAQASIRAAMFTSGRMLSTLSDRYVPFSGVDIDADEARPIDEITDQDRDSNALQSWLADHGGTVDDYRFFRYGARYAYCYLGFDSKTTQFAGLLEVPAPT